MVVDATEKQMLQSEALLHLPGHRTKHTHVLRDLSTEMGVDNEVDSKFCEEAVQKETWLL